MLYSGTDPESYITKYTSIRRKNYFTCANRRGLGVQR